MSTDKIKVTINWDSSELDRALNQSIARAKRKSELTWTGGAIISLLVGIALFVVVKIAENIDRIPNFIWVILLVVFSLWGILRVVNKMIL